MGGEQTMTIARFINALAERDIRLWVEGGELKFSAPAGGFDSNTRAGVMARKPELIAFLAQAGSLSDEQRFESAPALEHPPLSAGEERLWFLYRYEGLSPVYNVLTTMHTRDAVDVSHHQLALQRLVDRHESLRTRFDEVSGVPFRVVEAGASVVSPLIDLGAIACPEVLRREIDRLIADEEAHLFELTVAPLLRSVVLRLAGDEHVVMINIHHAATDAWSMGVLMREYSQMVAAFEQGVPCPLPTTTFRYADFAYWQQRQLRDGGFRPQLDFWHDYLAGLPPLLDLPTDFPRPAVKKYEGRSERCMLPSETTHALTALCGRHGATLFMGLLAAFKLMLARYTNSRDIAVGTAVAGRRFAELDNVVGMFTNTIVLRTQIDENLSFGSLIERVRDATLAAQANQDIPFRAVVEALVSERSLSYTPLYQVSLALNNAAENEVVELAAQAEQYSDNDGIVSTAVKDDLSLQFRRFPDGLEFKLTYDVHLFSAATARRMSRHFATLLEQLLDRPLQPLHRASLVDADEQGRLIALSTNTGASYPSGQTLHALFDAQCESAPDAIAVQHDDLQLSYGTLGKLVERLAGQLQANGARPLDRIGLCVERSIEMVAGMLAILKVGAAYVPLDRAYPRRALDHIVADTGLRLVLTSMDEHPWSTSDDVRVIRFDTSHAGLMEATFAPVDIEFGESHPAYVIYTSGSTGAAKGVEVSHRNVVRLVQCSDFVPITASDVFAQISNHAFDAATFEVWGALTNGARLVGLDRDILLDPADMACFLRANSVSAIFVTTALFNLFADADPGTLASVRHVLFGGETANPEAVRRVFQQTKPARLVHVYGPTETTTFSTWFEFRNESETERCPIGGAIAHSSAYVVDSLGQLVPVGVVGELLLGGDGVSLGYLGRPDLTAERFVPDPFSTQPGQRLYRSGDWVKRNQSGEIEYLGRFDNQVKIRGFRVETGEIEEHLARHALVSEAVVVVNTDGRGDKRLFAYLVTEHGDADLPAVRLYLKEQLPEYKHPSTYFCLERMPLTPNGKVDRARLPTLEALAVGTSAAIAPRDEIEREVADEWRNLLSVGSVAIDDNFFELGGHSLLAITLSVRLRDRLGVELSTRDVFEHPTIEALASRIREGKRSLAPLLPPITKATKRQKSTLSFMQQRLWFIDQMEAAGPTYHMPLVLGISSQYDGEAIIGALATMLARHESLRTAFVEVNGIPMQRVVTAALPIVSTVDLSSLPEPLRDFCRDEVIGMEFSRPFDLGEAPLLRALLIRLPDEEKLLVVTVHHIVCDGWSIGNLTRELGALLVDPTAALPELAVQYGDYAHWQKTWLDGDVLQRQLDYWRSKLDGAPDVLTLRCARARALERSDVGQTHADVFDVALATRIKQLAHREGCSVFMVMLAAFKLLLSRHADRDDIVVGTPIANRPRSELEPLVGFFANTLVLRTRVHGNDSFLELLRRVRDTTLEAYAYQDTPLDLLVDALNPERSLAYSPLIQVVFGQENFGALGATLPPGIAPVSLRAGNQTSKFDLNLSFEETAQGLQLYCEYSDDLFEASTVARLVGQYRDLLHRVVQAPRDSLDCIPLFDVETEAAVRAVLNEAADAPKEVLPVHALFEATARRMPATVALIGEDETVTYAGLDAAASRIARLLRNAGVMAETPVGICMARSPQSIAAMLGVLKAGGAYVPLDPDESNERLRAIVVAAGLHSVLVDATTRGVVASLDVTCIEPDDAGSEVVVLPEACIAPHIGSEGLACILYSPDQSGELKGIAIPHRGITRLVRDGGYLPFADGLRTMLTSPPAFDAALFEIWAPLLNGGQLVVVATPPADLEDFTDALLRHRVDTLWLTTTLLEAWVKQLDRELDDLRHVVTGGDILAPATVASLYERLPGVRLIVVHGPSENTTFSTSHEVARNHRAGMPVPIGRAIATSTAYVLDAAFSYVPVGVSGTLFVGGDGVARNYVGDPAQTASCFLPDPFSRVPGARMFGTGDRVVLREDGTLEYLGRTDSRVTIGRFRIDPSEVEGSLRTRADVQDAVVVVHADEQGEKRLVAFVVMTGDAEVAALQIELAGTWPEYLVPSVFIPLDAIPVTQSGAVDRHFLIRRLRPAVTAREHVAPATPTEIAIAQVWGNLLGRSAVGRHDNFFELGGHSLLAAQACALINRHFGTELRVRQFYSSPDLAAFAERVDAATDLERLLSAFDPDTCSDEDAERLLAQLQPEA